MTSTTRVAIGGAFVIGLGLGWALNGASGVVDAQAPPTPFMMHRVYTGTDGLSHVEKIPLNAQSMLEKVTGARISVSQPGSFSDYHVGPERRYIINLTSGGQLQVAEGKVNLPAGSIEVHRRPDRQGAHDGERGQGAAPLHLAAVRQSEAGHRTDGEEVVHSSSRRSTSSASTASRYCTAHRPASSSDAADTMT